MKKTVRIVFVLLFVLGLLQVIAPLKAEAKPGSGSDVLGIADGAWTVTPGMVTEINITKAASTAPTWIQLLTDGIITAGPGKICHPFRGGQFGWIGEIMQLKDGLWVKLPTTSGWVPSTEGEYMACAQAPAAGTYALFGYYIAPQKVASSVSVDCSTLVWNSTASGGITLSGTVSGLPSGTEITFSIESSTPAGITFTGPTSTTTTDAAGTYSLDTSTSGSPDSLTILYSASAYGCTYTKTHYF
jgi:hypothetical protein